MEMIEVPSMLWVVAGKNGMELHGYNANLVVEEAVEQGVEPDIVVAVHPLHWDFRFPVCDGSGRVRVGAGCQYNPMQMIEAMWGHVCSIEADTTDVIHLDFDAEDLSFDPMKPFGEEFQAKWGDGDLE